MSEVQQREFIEKLIEAKRKSNSPDLIREWKMRDEELRINQCRSFYRENYWSL